MAVFITPTPLTWVTVGTTQWVTYNLSGIVPSNATGVILNYGQSAGTQNIILVRSTGSTFSALPGAVTGASEQTVLYSGIDSNLNIEVYTQASATNSLWVLGYFTSYDGGLFTNPIQQSATTSSTWTSYDFSVYGSTTAVAAIIYLPYYNGAVRINGSTDTFGNGNESAPGARYHIVGLDASKICQIFTSGSQLPYLVGFITSGFVWNTNAILRTPSTAGSFQPLTARSNAIGYLYNLNSPTTKYNYSLCSTAVSGYAPNLANPGQLTGQMPSGGAQAQINIQNTALAVYELGYFTGPSVNTRGINFRNSLAYVTDPTGTVGFPGRGGGQFNLLPYPYSVTPNGDTFNCGWDAIVNNEDGARDRAVNTGVAAELSGINAVTATGSPVGIRAFSIQLPSAGTYLIWLALGDGAGGNASTFPGGSGCGIYDGGTVGGAYNSGGEKLLRSLEYGTTTSSTWFDAAGNLLNQSQWTASNGGTGGGTPVVCTFQTAVCKLVLGNINGSGGGAVAHLRIQQVSSILVNTQVVTSLRNTGNLLTNSNIPFDENALYNGSLSFDTTTYYKPSTTIATVSGDFTLETWVYPLSYADMMVASSDIDSNLQIFRINQSGNLGSVSVYNNGTQIFNNVGTSTIPGQWTHLAWVRSGTTNTLYINGVSSATFTNSTAFNFNIIGTFGFNGAIGYGGNAWYNGYVKDFRLTTSVVYTGNFTPPTSVLSKLANTIFLLNVTDYYNRFYDAALGATNIKSPLLGSPLPGFSLNSPYTQSTPTTQSRITQNEVVYNELDELTINGGSIASRLTNTGSMQIAGIFDEVTGIPSNTTIYVTTARQIQNTYTHTIPAGYSVMVIEAWGGGGGGAQVYEDTGGNSPSYTSSGGTDPGAGGYCRTILTNAASLAGLTLSITVGGGGTGRGLGGGNFSALAGNTSTVSSGTATITTMTAGGGGGGIGSGFTAAAGGTATGGTDANIVGTNTTGIAYSYTAPNSSQTPPNGIMYTPNLGVVGYYGARYGSAGRVIKNLTSKGNYGTYTDGGDNGLTGAVVISYY